MRGLGPKMDSQSRNEGYRKMVPFFMIEGSVISTAVILSLTAGHPAEVYMTTLFQLIFLVVVTFEIYKRFYSYGMTVLGILTLVVQFFLRELNQDGVHSMVHSLDYLLAIVLLLSMGFFLGRILKQKKGRMSLLEENDDKFTKAFRTNPDSFSITVVSTGLLSMRLTGESFG